MRRCPALSESAGGERGAGAILKGRSGRGWEHCYGGRQGPQRSAGTYGGPRGSEEPRGAARGGHSGQQGPTAAGGGHRSLGRRPRLSLKLPCRLPRGPPVPGTTHLTLLASPPARATSVVFLLREEPGAGEGDPGTLGSGGHAVCGQRVRDGHREGGPGQPAVTGIRRSARCLQGRHWGRFFSHHTVVCAESFETGVSCC